MAIESTRASNRTFLLEARNSRIDRAEAIARLEALTRALLLEARILESIKQHIASSTRSVEQEIPVRLDIESSRTSRTFEHAGSKSHL
jgi:hypothetical protein